jgi:hypothetical protein
LEKSGLKSNFVEGFESGANTEAIGMNIKTALLRVNSG